MTVAMPLVRDQGKNSSLDRTILPAYLRRTKALEELLLWRYLKGISTDDFQEAMSVLLGSNFPGLSFSTISQLNAIWEDEHHGWERRDLSTRAMSRCGSMAFTLVYR